MKKRLIKTIIITAAVIAGGCILLSAMRFFGLHFPCPLEVATGIKCPTCGATRATMRILALDFRGALSYNLLIYFIWAFLIKLYLEFAIGYIKYGELTLHRGFFNIFACAIIVIWGFVRNFLGI